MTAHGVRCEINDDLGFEEFDNLLNKIYQLGYAAATDQKIEGDFDAIRTRMLAHDAAQRANAGTSPEAIAVLRQIITVKNTGIRPAINELWNATEAFIKAGAPGIGDGAQTVAGPVPVHTA